MPQRSHEFSAQYEAGANPTVVLTDLADFTHLVTRLKYVPDAASDQSLSEIERTRGAEFAGNVAVSDAVAHLADAAEGHS